MEMRVRDDLIMMRRMSCFSDENLCRWTFANCDDPGDRFIQSMRSYCDHFPDMQRDNVGLILYGEVGSGKTYNAACVANELADRGYTVQMTDFSRIINTLWGMSSDRQKYLDSLIRNDMLIIDDLAAERDTSYANEIVMNVIDSRCKSGKPLIVTTNLTADDLFNPDNTTKKRIYSRLCEMCIPVHCMGKKDRRKQKMMQNISKYREKLGI